MANQSLIVQTVIKACYKVGRSLMRDITEVEHINKDINGRHLFVNNAAIKSERMIASELSNARPSYHFFMKKGGYIPMSSLNDAITNGEKYFHRWVINTIDGEENFANGSQDFAVNVALERVLIPEYIHDTTTLVNYSSKNPGNTLLAICYLPAYREIYWAEKGMGSHYIDSYDQPKKIIPSNKSNVTGSLASASSFLLSQSQEISKKATKLVQYLKNKEISWRCSGCYSINMINLIRGKWDISISDEQTQYNEHAAIKLILSETDIPLLPLADKTNQLMNHEFVAANKFLLKEISEAVSL
jgi:fructose-1,6-bisphosphatase/inositol monophosphatase family enzyme